MPTQIICAKCNTAVEDGAVFCPECGTKVEPVDEPDSETNLAVVFCSECGTQVTTDFAFCPECGAPVAEGEAGAPVAEGTEKKRAFPKIKPLYIGIAAAVVVIAAVAIFVLTRGGASGGGDYLLYAKDDELQFSYMPKVNAFQLTERFDDGNRDFDADDFMSLAAYVIVSKDNRYAFYPDREWEDGATYYWRDLKEGGGKNAVSTKIDSEIQEVPRLCADGSKLFYIKGDDERLYVYDRKSGEKSKLDDSVSEYSVNKAGNYIIYSVYEDGEYTIFEMTLKGLTGERTKIDSNSQISTAYAEQKKVYYLKEETLYFKESGKDKVRIDSDVARVISIVENSSVYYLKTEEVESKLSDFINDDLLSDDKNTSEPAVPNYPPEPEAPYEYDYQTQVWVDDYWGSDINPVTGEWGYWSAEVDWDRYNDDYTKYSADMEIWRETYNSMLAEYEEKLSLYEGRASRDELREALQSADNSVKYNRYDLYYWTTSGSKLVSEDVVFESYSYLLASSLYAPVVVYQKYGESGGEGQKLSNILSGQSGSFYVDSVVSMIQNDAANIREATEDIYVASKEKESSIACEEAISWRVSRNGEVYFIDDYDRDEGYGTLMSAAISNNTASKPVKIDDDVSSYVLGNDNSNVYYFKDVKDGSGDLYSAGKLMASDVYTRSLYNFEGSNTLLYYIDYSSKNTEGTLCIYKGGTQSKLADDVSSFAPLAEEKAVFLIDYNWSRERGDLMLYNGGKSPVQIDTDVTAIIWNLDMLWGDYYRYYFW